MIGNDIVDLSLAKRQSNWQRPRYLDKVFTSIEQSFIITSENPTLSIWHLWSAKEAAYKLYTQLCPNRFYNPKAFEYNVYNSEVTFKTFKCFISLNVSENYVLSEAHLTPKKLSSKVFKLKTSNIKQQSQYLKSKLLDLASVQLGCSSADLSIIKNCYGIPELYWHNKPFNVSLSHHGNYGAIALS